MKKIYKISGMDCPSCATLLEMDLQDAGISCKCSYAKETLEIEYINSEQEEIKVIEIIKKTGYNLSNE